LQLRKVSLDIELRNSSCLNSFIHDFIFYLTAAYSNAIILTNIRKKQIFADDDKIRSDCIVTTVVKTRVPFPLWLGLFH
jgi:hypothetical protein